MQYLDGDSVQFGQILYFVEARCASEVLMFAAIKSIVEALLGECKFPHVYEGFSANWSNPNWSKIRHLKSTCLKGMWGAFSCEPTWYKCE